VGEDARLAQEIHVETVSGDRLHEGPLEEGGEGALRGLLEEALDLGLGRGIGLSELAEEHRLAHHHPRRGVRARESIQSRNS